MYRFNVRVYGILIEDQRLLVSDERIKGLHITKLPGGGLEFGEGTCEGLIREFQEELGLKIKILSHFYTTDFFVASAFNTRSQVISIYYTVAPEEPIRKFISNKPFDFEDKDPIQQSFRWIKINQLSENDFTFVIDKRVANLLNPIV